MGSKGTCLVFVVLAHAEGFVFRLPASSWSQHHVSPSRLQSDVVGRERRTYCSSVTYLSVEGSKEEDSRIGANSEELLKWFSGVGGLVGSVELEGKMT